MVLKTPAKQLQEPSQSIEEFLNKWTDFLYMTATTITDLFYIVRKAKGKDIALVFIEDLLQYVDVAAVDKLVILRALKLGLADFRVELRS